MKKRWEGGWDECKEHPELEVCTCTPVPPLPIPMAARAHHGPREKGGQGYGQGNGLIEEPAPKGMLTSLLSRRFY